MSRAVGGMRYQAGAPTPRWTSLREWGIRPKLIIVLAIPTLAALLLGLAEMRSALNQTGAYRQVEDLSTAGRRVSVLVVALQAERDLTADRVAQRKQSLPAVEKQVVLVDRAAADLRARLADIDTSYDPVVQRDVNTALSALTALPELRGRTTLGPAVAASVVSGYTPIIAALLRINSHLWVGSDDSALVQRVASMQTVAQSAELASQQRALLDVALQSKGFQGTALPDLIAARAQQQAAITAFLASATPEDQQLYRRTVTGLDVDRAATVLRTALEGRTTVGVGANANEWYLMKSEEVDRANQVAFKQLEAITARAQQLRNDAQLGAVRAGLIIMLILLFALIATIGVARSMIRPLQRLRSAALEVAEQGLPDVLRRLHEGETQDFDQTVRPVEVAARDEIGQVARAFDEVHAQAVRLAGEQALMRKSMNAMFVNLSRRSQSLVERQLRVIDELETSEQDPDQLASLFTLDLLATRMRRNDENLLVLAGAEGGRRWATPVPLLDVVRAAVAEVEQYARIRVNVEGGFELVHTAVGGVVHLLAELLENAASFSAPDTPVEVRAGSLGASGEVMIEVEDHGIGMTASQMARANERLAAPPAFDVSASRMMGLYVVARLAQRHDIKVRLRSSPNSGLIAVVQLPDRLILRASSGATATGGDDYLSAAPAPDQRAVAPAPDSNSAPLLIFDTIQSEWFKRSVPHDQPTPSPGLHAGRFPEPSMARRAWTSPADEGWRAAQALSTPVSGGVTPAGLPIRVRGSNLVPGQAAGTTDSAPSRPAHAARGLSSFQRGVLRGRTGGGAGDPAGAPSGATDTTVARHGDGRP